MRRRFQGQRLRQGLLGGLKVQPLSCLRSYMCATLLGSSAQGGSAPSGASHATGTPVARRHLSAVS